MRRFAIINQKGGVGKTTTTANLGAALAKAGLRVLLVDLDPQGHLTLHFGAEVADDQPSIYDMLTAGTPVEKVVLSVRDRLTLVPADIDLAGAEVELISVTGREVLLREALQAVEHDHDVLLIDCPPSLGVLTINALVAANEVLIPLQAHFFGLQGISKLLETITLVQQRINPSLQVHGVALCMHESATRLATEVTEDLTRFLEAARGAGTAWSNARIYQTSIRRNIKLAESSSFGQTVFDYAPRSNGAADYARLAAEVFGDIAPALRADHSAATASETRATKQDDDQGNALATADEAAAATKANGDTAAVEDASPGATVAGKPAAGCLNGSGERRTATKSAPKAPPPVSDSPAKPEEQADLKREAAAATM